MQERMFELAAEMENKLESVYPYEFMVEGVITEDVDRNVNISNNMIDHALEKYPAGRENVWLISLEFTLWNPPQIHLLPEKPHEVPESNQELQVRHETESGIEYELSMLIPE